MQIHRNYKYRLYPNKSQIDLLNSHFFSSNQAWNYMLDFKIKELNNQKYTKRATESIIESLKNSKKDILI